MIETQTRPQVDHAVTQADGDADALPGHEVRSVGLLLAGLQLGMSVGDFDCVRVANARADLRCCPLCRSSVRTLAG